MGQHPIPGPLLSEFLQSLAAEAHSYVQRHEDQDHPLAEDGQDPWYRQRRQQGFDLSFRVHSPRDEYGVVGLGKSGIYITWMDVVHTLDGLFGLLEDPEEEGGRPDELPAFVEIVYVNTMQACGIASVGVDLVSDAEGGGGHVDGTGGIVALPSSNSTGDGQDEGQNVADVLCGRTCSNSTATS